MLFFIDIQETKQQNRQKKKKASWAKILEAMSQNNSLFS